MALDARDMEQMAHMRQYFEDLTTFQFEVHIFSEYLRVRVIYGHDLMF